MEGRLNWYGGTVIRDIPYAVMIAWMAGVMGWASRQGGYKAECYRPRV